MRTLILACSLLCCVLTACYKPALGDCQVRCGAGSSCPSGLTCDSAEGFCQADMATVCAALPPDDGGVPDGAVPPGEDTYLALSTGDAHACAIRADRSMWCWGFGPDGALGDGQTRRSAVPVRAGEASFDDWFAVSAGLDYSCGLRGDPGGGELYCWGLNNLAQCDLDTRGTNPIAPLDVSLGKKWKAVSAGRGGTTCAIDDADVLHCGGDNDEGQTGTATAGEPIALTPVDSTLTFRAVSAGYFHTCAIPTAGELYCWGGNNAGQGNDGVLGTGDDQNHLSPARVGTASDWIAIATSANFSCGIRGSAAGGNLYCWGRNSGNLGTPGGGAERQPTPVRVGAMGDDDWKTIDVGFRHSCGVRAQDGKDLLYCFGLGRQAELGLGDRGDHASPTALDARAAWLDAGTGQRYGCGLRADGAILCWGTDDDGQLGDGRASMEFEPVQVGSDSGWTTVTGGEQHTCALRGKDLYRWGDNVHGQLGLGAGDSQDRGVPTQVPGAWLEVTTGFAHTCAIEDGTNALYCWGFHEDGQLGTGDATNTSPHGAPKKVAGTVTSWLHVDGGGAHTCAVSSGRELWCWGANYGKQLGQGDDTGGRVKPVRVGTAVEWQEVAAGQGYTCAIHEDTPGQTAVYCFGENDHGQLGRGGLPGDSSGAIDVPVVGAVLPWGRLIAGNQHVCGLVGDSGSLRCWGANGTGALGLGDGELSDGTTPAPPMDDPSALSVATGGGHTCYASRSDGTLQCWGTDENGVLGLGEPKGFIYDVPMAVGNDTDWTQVFAGIGHTCAIKTNGTLWCWGRNTFGQVGAGQGATLRPTRIADGE